MSLATIKVSTYIGALAVTIVGAGASLIILHVANTAPNFVGHGYVADPISSIGAAQGSR
jgi:homoserine kinase